MTAVRDIKPPRLFAVAVVAALAACAALFAFPAAAEDTALLIQIGADGRYTVWHAGGQPPLGVEEITALEATARPEGGQPTVTVAGPAQAIETDQGVIIRLPALGPEKTLFIDRDACGGIKVWLAGGETRLSEDELTQLVLSALPDGGQNVDFGTYRAKAYSTKSGVVAAIWRPLAKPGADAGKSGR